MSLLSFASYGSGTICFKGRSHRRGYGSMGVSTYESAFIDVRYNPVATNSALHRSVAMGTRTDMASFDQIVGAG
jgi:hypothetical protein